MVTIQKNKLNDPEFWSKVNMLKKTNDVNSEIDIFQVFYWLNSGNLKIFYSFTYSTLFYIIFFNV